MRRACDSRRETPALHEEMRHEILRIIFEDQRAEMAQALQDLRAATPPPMVEFQPAADAAIARIYKAARLQPPSDYPLL